MATRTAATRSGPRRHSPRSKFLKKNRLWRICPSRLSDSRSICGLKGLRSPAQGAAQLSAGERSETLGKKESGSELHRGLKGRAEPEAPNPSPFQGLVCCAEL